MIIFVQQFAVIYSTFLNLYRSRFYGVYTNIVEKAAVFLLDGSQGSLLKTLLKVLCNDKK